MKIALYIEDGLEQLVLTPEGNHETNLLGLLANGSRTVEIKQGQFFENQLGWVRHTSTPQSTMIVLRPAIVDRSPQGGDGEAGSIHESDGAQSAIAQMEPDYD